jgi:prolyl-tRNA editing enzyme YbaK/EbsC (Cys-tRNA(Pro) deacylase)
MEYHTVTKQITSILTENGCWFETFEHAPVRTSEEASKLRLGYTISQGAKTIIVRVREPGIGKKFVMLIIPGDKKFDPVKVRENFKLSDLRFATEAEVDKITGGVLPGGVPPFGNLFGLDVIADNEVFKNEKIVFNAGDKSFSVAMLSADYARLVKPKTGSII